MSILPVFGDYELLSEIARGGMGVVYRARQRSLNRLVAVKMIIAGQLATQESLERFRLEAQAAAGLHHPGIVPIYEIGEYETQNFFSMELIEGPSLSECLAEFSVNPNASHAERQTEQRCLAELMARVARAIGFAHQHGVLHRDLKPSNILIDSQGLPHLTDFGLAKLTGREHSGLTLSHAVLGTPGYLAPEQAAGSDQITTATDIYGLGATLYELLTGRPPFVGTNALETMWKAIDQTPVAPRQLHPTLARDLETIAMRCLENRPEQRYPSAVAVAEDLERFVRGEPIHARPVSLWEYTTRWCHRNPWLATLALLLMLTFLIGSGVGMWQWSRAENANVNLRDSLVHLQWASIDDMLQTGQTSFALARVASLLRQDPTDWKAAMFAISVMEQHRFPVPVAPLITHSDTDLRVARLSPDGQRIATASLDGTARIWDAPTFQQTSFELKHQASVYWLEFSPDSRLLATCSEDQTACLWDVKTGKRIWEPFVHTEPVKWLRFSPDNRFLLTKTEKTVSIWEVSNGQRYFGPLAHQGGVAEAKFVKNGACFFTAQRGKQRSVIQVWDLHTKTQWTKFETDPLIAADMSHDMTRLVTVGSTKACIWDVSDSRKLEEIDHNCPLLPYVCISPNGDRFATSTRLDWARVWDIETGLPVTGKLSHYYFINGIQFLDQGERLLTWSDDSTAQVWDLESGKPHFETMRHANRVQHAEVGHCDGEEVILTTIAHHNLLRAPSQRDVAEQQLGTYQRGAAQLWRVHDTVKESRRVVGVDPNGVDASMVSPDGQWAAFGTTFYKVHVVKIETGDPICDPLPVLGNAWALMFTPDSQRLIATTSRGQIKAWSLPEGKLLYESLKSSTTYNPAEISNDGEFFVTGSTDGIVRLWETATGRIVYEMNHGEGINALSFSPNGDWVASAGEDHLVCIWSLQTGKLVRKLEGHQNEVMKVVVSPQGDRLVTASPDFTARIWQASTGELLHVLPHQGEVVDAVFSPDGRFVASGARDRTAKIWNAETGQLHVRDLLHEHAVRNVVFSPDGKRLLTIDFRGPRQWDVASGHPLTVRLPQPLLTGTGFQNTSGSSHFTPNGNTIFVAPGSLEAVSWDVPVPPAEVPIWFPEFLESVAGQRVDPETDTPESVPAVRFLDIRKQLRTSTDTDFYTDWARQWIQGS